MMRLDEIRNPQFAPAKKDGYDSYDVDNYVSKVYDTVSTILKTAKQAEDKLKNYTELVQKYNEEKEALSELLIESRAKAQRVKKEADEVAASVKERAQNEANEMRESARAILDNAEASANQKYDEIIASADEKATSIVDQANENAAKIVSDAYSTANKAKEATEQIISEANASLEEIRAKIIDLKSVYSSISSQISTLLNAINIPDSVSSVLDDVSSQGE